MPEGSGGGRLGDDSLRDDALDYHAAEPAGKITVVPTKPHGTQRELSLAYSPGVAYPCKEIESNPDEAYKYTSKGNLVAVVSNGTAVLGLGDIGALAGKPVMEGKGLLFKAFADIDVFDIEVDRTDVDEFVEAVKAIAPTFGGINLEDIKAPECFEIERRLVKELDIPDARRPARHRDYLRSGPAQRAGGRREGHRRDQGGRLGSRCLCNLLRPPLHQARSETREHDSRRLQGHPDRLTQLSLIHI